MSTSTTNITNAQKRTMDVNIRKPKQHTGCRHPQEENCKRKRVTGC